MEVVFQAETSWIFPVTFLVYPAENGWKATGCFAGLSACSTS
jgi:hypothetical protein